MKELMGEMDRSLERLLFEHVVEGWIRCRASRLMLDSLQKAKKGQVHGL